MQDRVGTLASKQPPIGLNITDLLLGYLLEQVANH